MPTLNRLAAPPNLPAQESGTFTLYKDANWGGQKLTFALGDHVQNDRHSVVGTPLQDQADWVAFNLPPGTVVTLTENFTATPGNPGDLTGAGRCVDLVGTGRSDGVDLRACNMHDCVSGFFWRDDVHLEQGAVVLYEDSAFQGNRSVLFLSDWERDKAFSLKGWYLHDKASSISWDGLSDLSRVTFFDHDDGTGVSYSDVKGWGTTKEIAHLKDVSANDILSSFRWTGLIPKKEIIAPFTLTPSSNGNDVKGLTETVTQDNWAPTDQKFTLTFLKNQTRTLTVTSTQTHTAGGSLEFTHEVETGVKEVETTNSVTVNVHYDYTNTKTTEDSQSEKIELSFQEEVTVPARSTTSAVVLAQVADFPSVTCPTTATRWYDQPVTGGVRDPAESNWWKREEKVSFVVAGGVGLTSRVTTTSNPLPPR